MLCTLFTNCLIYVFSTWFTFDYNMYRQQFPLAQESYAWWTDWPLWACHKQCIWFWGLISVGFACFHMHPSNQCCRTPETTRWSLPGPQLYPSCLWCPWKTKTHHRAHVSRRRYSRKCVLDFQRYDLSVYLHWKLILFHYLNASKKPDALQKFGLNIPPAVTHFLHIVQLFLGAGLCEKAERQVVEQNRCVEPLRW